SKHTEGSHEIFFFSSRRRHTRSKRDWSSDVCSSDLYFSVFGACVGAIASYLYLFAYLRERWGHYKQLLENSEERALNNVTRSLQIGRASCRENWKMRAGVVAEEQQVTDLSRHDRIQI